jgi:hypothetical protein
VNAEDLTAIYARRNCVVELSNLLDSTSPSRDVWRLLDAALDSSQDVDVLLHDLDDK